jgi:hypothetical protein
MPVLVFVTCTVAVPITVLWESVILPVSDAAVDWLFAIPEKSTRTRNAAAGAHRNILLRSEMRFANTPPRRAAVQSGSILREPLRTENQDRLAGTDT